MCVYTGAQGPRLTAKHDAMAKKRNARGQFVKMTPSPPVPLPSNPPTAGIRPAPDMPSSTSWKDKPLLSSKTILTIIGTILVFVLSKFFGIDIDWGSIVGTDGVLTVGELLLLIGSVLAGYFRKIADGPINGFIRTPPPFR